MGLPKPAPNEKACRRRPHASPKGSLINLSHLREVFETLVRITYGYRYLGKVLRVQYLGAIL